MTERPNFFDPDALQRAVPRYTSYPTAPHFGPQVSASDYERWLGALAPGSALSLYLHIPFCDDLCWFCACRTQGAKRYPPVIRYLGFLIREIEMVGARLGKDHPVTHIHWGGGSPTVLRPAEILALARALDAAFPKRGACDVAVEIDPRDMTGAKLDALIEAGLTRASIGVQDFDPAVQQAIGRHQGHAMTRDVVLGLRERGVGSVNIDLLYGLPLQSEDSLTRTIDQVLALSPDRLALFGYAHVPWMAKRQKMIDNDSLPDSAARRAQAAMARRLLTEAGYEAIGIDHFAKPGDALAEAAREGRLKRNFQGYTVDDAAALVAFGASAIGSLPQGYVQNDPTTATYQLAIEAGRLPVKKGIMLNLDDQIRRSAIEQILCGFALDLDGLAKRYGDFVRPIAETAAHLLAAAPQGALVPWQGGFQIAEAWRDRTRLIAAEFDAYLGSQPARHSLAV